MTTEDGPTVRDRWIGEVLRTPHLTDAVRVALLAVAREMDDDGMVSFRVKELAEWIGRSERRAIERIAAAIDVGFFERVSRGQRNGPGRYRAAFPGSGSSGHPGVTKNPSVFRTPGGPQEDSLQDGLQPEETSRLQDTRGSRRTPFDPSVFRTPGGPQEPAPSIRNRARAHSKQPPQPPTTHHTHRDKPTSGQVVHLFDAEKPPKKTHTPARTRGNPTPDEHPAFAEFWAAYPRHVAKAAARKAFTKAIKNGADPADIILGARRYAADPRRAAADIRYTAHPATWLNQERWLDEPEPAYQPTTGRLSTTDQRIAQAQALKALYADRPDRPRTIRGEITR